MKTATPSVWNHGKNFYGNVLLNPSTLANIAKSEETWRELLTFHHLLATDEYVQYVDAFYRESLDRFGRAWEYFDIVNVLYAAAKTIQPKSYLEIGTRRGRSVCAAVHGAPEMNILSCDIWDPTYAGMENPGPTLVRQELHKHGHKGTISFLDGDSHELIPAFFKRNPSTTFDLITVDGDHSEAGAFDDLCNVIPHLAIGGVLVFDDIGHPEHLYLLHVWRRAMDKFPGLAAFEFKESGFGVAFAIRRS